MESMEGLRFIGSDTNRFLEIRLKIRRTFVLRGGHTEQGGVFSIFLAFLPRYLSYVPMTIYTASGDAHELATGVANSETRRLIVMFYCYTAFGAWRGISPSSTCVSRWRNGIHVYYGGRSDTLALYNDKRTLFFEHQFYFHSLEIELKLIKCLSYSICFRIKRNYSI